MSMVATANLPLQFPPENVMFGQSETMQIIRAKIDKLAAASLPLLISGESGTGKELIARFIHARSPWQNGPFLKVNCASMPEAPMEAELRGDTLRGTLYLHNIAESSPAFQAKLLEFLQGDQFCDIGPQGGGKLSMRVVCSASRDLFQQVAAGQFREDLFYRINVLNLQLPPLRARSGDLRALVAYFMQLYSERYECQDKPLSSELFQKLIDYEWPGNIRELENLIKRYVILGTDEAISTELLPHEARAVFQPEIPADGQVSLKKLTRQAVRELERQVILRSLQANNWNRKRVARALNISYRALLYKIQDAGLTQPRSRRVPVPIDGSERRAA